MAATPDTAQHRRHSEELSELRRKLRTSQTERRRLQTHLDAAASVIAILVAENTALREQPAQHSTVIVPIPRPSI
ncbi:hypothetical protein ACFV5J_10805 [Streptomyces zaomyceticus]|uniref:hypothetical protein n=1 Tax=Streptomyces zaomyceticus TaxID=68286 RepID=UPI00364D2993